MVLGVCELRILFFIFIFFGFSFANNFIDAIKNGKPNGDINLLFDYVNSNPQDKNQTKYQTGSFLATTFGLYYKSAFYTNFRINIGFRGALPLWEQSKKSSYIGGFGSAARDFWDNNRAMIARSYLEYFDGDTSIKAGRIEDGSDLISNHFDGVWLSNKSIGWLLIDFVYMNQYGMVLDRELSGFDKIQRWSNGSPIGYTRYGGAYYLGLTFEVLEWLKLKAYGQIVPDIYSYIAGKVAIDTTYFEAQAGFVGGYEHRYSEFSDNSYLFHSDVGGKFEGDFGKVYANLGYINTSNGAGMGSLRISGNSFNPFFYFSGDALNYYRAVNLVYGKIGYEASFLDVYLVYGFNWFKNKLTTDYTRYKQGEINLYFDWNILDTANIIIHFLNTHGSKSAIPNITQASLIFKIRF